MYKSGVAAVITKLAYDNIYGDQEELLKHMYSVKKTSTSQWRNWWHYWLKDAGLSEKLIDAYVDKYAMYSAEQCGVTLCDIDADTGKEVYDLYDKQAMLFRSEAFEKAAAALNELCDYCRDTGLIDYEAIDENGRAGISLSIAIQQTRYDSTQRTYMEVVMRDEKNKMSIFDKEI